MMYLRYWGNFAGIDHTGWRVEIWQDLESEPVQEELSFPADSPLIIEWAATDKYIPLQSSSATLKVLSETDRKYIGLYAVVPASVRLDIYRNSVLYWSGTLDTELYEEPYSYVEDYEVTLTFADFAVLDRLKYTLSGMQTLQAIISSCITSSGIKVNGIDTSMISTQLPASSTHIELSDLEVLSDNFFDEDGDALSLENVINGILQPLALRMVQRCGKIYIYDLNGLYNSGETQLIRWNNSNQVLGVDVVYNNAKITWSPYAMSGNCAPESCWDSSIPTPASLIALNTPNGVTQNGATYLSYHYSGELDDWLDAGDCGFTLWTAKTGNNAILGENTEFFRIVPQLDGNEAEGIAIRWRGVRGYKLSASGSSETMFQSVAHGVTEDELAGTLASVGGLLFRSADIYIPKVEKPESLLLRIKIELLLDPRFNPFESASNIHSSFEQKDWYEHFNTFGNFVYVPVVVKFQPTGSSTVYVWTNQEVVSQNISSPVIALPKTYGQWVQVSGNDNTWGYLAYYDTQDRDRTSGVMGWKANRPAINPHIKEMYSALTNAADGQCIPYPANGGGKLWVEVRKGSWQISDGNKNLSATEVQSPKSLWSKISWILMKLPSVEIINNRQFDQDIDAEDIEYNAELNAYAKEPLEIETICGTSADGIPTARGAYFNAATSEQITNLTRAGRTSQVEDLFIGTLYSQYAARKTKLSGDANLLKNAGLIYIDASIPGDKLILVEDAQNLRDDTSTVTLIELRPDEYVKRD